MPIWTIVMVLVAVMIVVLAIFAVRQARKQNEIRKQHPGYPKGYWMNQGVGIGIALGAGIGVALNNLAIGVGVGVAIGAGIGSQMEKQHKDEIRPMTDAEKALQRQSIMMMTGTLLVGIVVFVLIYFVAR